LTTGAASTSMVTSAVMRATLMAADGHSVTNLRVRRVHERDTPLGFN